MRNLLVVAALAVLALPALADGRLPRVANDAVRKECGECHMAFQPQFLPRRSWDRIMATLGDHFGEDASLEEGTRREVAAYLAANAADVSKNREGRKMLRGIKADAVPLRITELPRWRHEHGPDEIRPRVWKRKSVGSKANCVACHKDAEGGYYDDD